MSQSMDSSEEFLSSPVGVVMRDSPVRLPVMRLDQEQVEEYQKVNHKTPTQQACGSVNAVQPNVFRIKYDWSWQYDSKLVHGIPVVVLDQMRDTLTMKDSKSLQLQESLSPSEETGHESEGQKFHPSVEHSLSTVTVQCPGQSSIPLISSKNGLSTSETESTKTTSEHPIIKKEPVSESEGCEDSYFVCNTCGEVFFRKELLFEHYSCKHDTDKTVGTKLPHPEYSGSGILHLSEVHTRNLQVNSFKPGAPVLKTGAQITVFKCYLCKLISVSLQDTINHLERMHGVKTSQNNTKTMYVCGNFKVGLPQLSDFHSHLKSVCQGSAGVTIPASLLNQQMAPKTVFTCDVCGFTSNSSDIADRHYQRHLLYKCGTCSQRFGSIKRVAVHIAEHIQLRYQCCACPMTFDNMAAFCKHKYCDKYEVLDNRLFKCKFCAKELSGRWAVEKHIMHHVKDRHFKCNVCGGEFYSKQYLQSHKMIHTGEKPLSCGVCGKKFRGAYNLKFHMRTHTGEKPYKCNVCGKGLTSSSALSTHYKRHIGDRNHRCDICGKTFYENPFLTRHIRSVHMKERNFECDICKKKFFDADKVKRHKLNVHKVGAVSAKCEHCEKTFSNSLKLKRHQKEHCCTG